MTGPLADLLDLPDIATAVADARGAVDQAYRHPALRGSASSSGARVAAEIGLRSAVASAALEGHPYDAESVRLGTVTDPVVQGALRVSAAVVALAPTWRNAPRQALARLHVLAARGCPGVPDESLGRPIGSAAVAARLDLLWRVVGAGAGTAPAVLRAAVIHGELLALRPFPGPSGVVARATARLVVIGDGLDPRGLLALEVGHLAREPEYLGAANAFSTGTRDGVRAWLRHCATAVQHAARELEAVADALPPVE